MGVSYGAEVRRRLNRRLRARDWLECSFGDGVVGRMLLTGSD